MQILFKKDITKKVYQKALKKLTYFFFGTQSLFMGKWNEIPFDGYRYQKQKGPRTRD